MTKDERIQMLNEAMELVEQAQQMVDEALNDSNLEAHYYAYERYGLNQFLGNGNPYDCGLPDLLKELKNEPVLEV